MAISKNDKAELHAVLSDLLKQHAYKRINGRAASERTVSAYTEVLRMCFNKLHDLGFKIQNPRNLNDTHIQALCRHWYESGLKASTMQEYLSKLRVFCEEWLGRSETVKSLPEYLPDVDANLLVVSKVAMQSKSWTENGVDVAEKIKLADEVDSRFGLMLRMMLAFGLRRKEVISTVPWKADKGDKLVIFPGEAKGGRPRDIYFDNVQQREVLDYVKSRLRKGEHLGWPHDSRGKPASFKYSLRRYHHSMAQIGITRNEANVTGHSLRAQYAENAAIIAGLLPFTLGGTNGQMDRDMLDVKRRQISELLGHSREDVTVSYYGSGGRSREPDPVDRRKGILERALQYCHPGVTKAVAVDRHADCLKIVSELESLGVEISMRKTQLLWEIHSQRHARHWIKPEQGIGEAVEAAAVRLLKQMEKAA